MVGALLEHSCSFILIANNSSSFQIIPFHSKSLLFINMFLDYFKQLLQYIYILTVVERFSGCVFLVGMVWIVCCFLCVIVY